MDNNSNSIHVVKEEKKNDEKVTENDLENQIDHLIKTIIGSNVICVLDIFVLDLFPKFLSKGLMLICLLAYSIFNILIWNSFRYQRFIIFNNRSSLITTKFLYSMIIIFLTSLVCFSYNFFLMVLIDESELNKLYYEGRKMYILLNVMTLLYIIMNLLIPFIYLKRLINLRKAFLHFNLNEIYYQPQANNTINSNSNSNVTPRSSSISLDVIDKK